MPRLPILRPTLWSIAACSTIYLGCASYEVYQDVRRVRAEASRQGYGSQSPKVPSFEDLERSRSRHAGHPGFPGFTILGSERPEFDPSSSKNLTMNIMAVTGALYAVSVTVSPSLMQHLTHTPALPRNYTLLTSVFGHGSVAHLAFNMYGMYMLLPAAAHAPTFKERAPHLLAFYLSTGILSSLATHAWAIWPKRAPYTSALGASGALFAFLGVLGASFPDTQIGIIFIPGYWPINDALPYIALFDAVGLFVRYPFLHFAHAAHLSGLLLGIAYVKYGAEEKIWRPSRRVAFSVMRSLKLV